GAAHAAHAGREPGKDRPEARPRWKRREREPAGEHAESDPEDGDAPRLGPARPSEAAVSGSGGHAGGSGSRRTPGALRRSFRRALQRYRMRTSAPTNRTIRPW